MNIVKMKIVGYDEINHSLLVSFASDTTASQNPADYSALAYQPITMWPDITDVTELTRRIAVAGMYQVQQQEIMEKFNANENRILELKSLVGQEFEYSVSSLVTIPTTANTQVVF
jgi:hypothetical protein